MNTIENIAIKRYVNLKMKNNVETIIEIIANNTNIIANNTIEIFINSSSFAYPKLNPFI